MIVWVAMALLVVAVFSLVKEFDLSAKANYVDTRDKISGFTMSLGTAIPASTVHVSQIRLGGQASYGSGTFVPYVGATYIRDLQSPSQAAFGGQTPANDKDGWQLTAGLNIFSRGAVSGGILFSTETGRQQVKNDVVLANIAVRF